MTSSLLARPSRPRPRFLPSVERLANRCLPACVMTQVGGVVEVLGDGGTNNVTVDDNGAGGRGTVSVQTESGTFFSHGVVTGVLVSTGNGRDRVFYNLTGDLRGGQRRTVVLDAGSGVNNLIGVNLQGGLQSKALLDVQVRGGTDRDHIFFTSSGDVAANSAMAVNILGGPGSDFITANLSGAVNGIVTFTADGGAFYDSLQATVTVGSGSAGRISVRLNGGMAPDLLRLTATKANAADRVGTLFVVDGGGGVDEGQRTFNVITTNVESDQPHS